MVFHSSSCRRRKCNVSVHLHIARSSCARTRRRYLFDGPYRCRTESSFQGCPDEYDRLKEHTCNEPSHNSHSDRTALKLHELIFRKGYHMLPFFFVRVMFFAPLGTLVGGGQNYTVFPELVTAGMHPRTSWVVILGRGF